MRRRGAPSLEALFAGAYALLGLRLGLRAIGDNSAFVHLRTGIDMVRSGSIPRVDRYSFTASGDPWLVQSWLAELAYGVAHRLGGFSAVRVLHGLLYAVLAWLLLRLVRTGVAWRTALAGGVAVGLGAVYWSPRPLAFGLVAFGAVVVLVEERRRPWLLVPVVWVWANTHGSFALGLGWLGLVCIGQWWDTRRRPDALPWLGWFSVGLVAACVNPLGPRLLAFPAVLVSKGESFRHVVEWQSPSFQSATGLLTLLSLVGAVMILARAREALGWSDLAPAAAFVLAGLLAQRNLAAASVVLAPAMGRALRVPATPAPASERSGERRLRVALAGGLLGLGVVYTAASAMEPGLDLRGYPVATERLVPPGSRLVTTDVAAGYRILRRGSGAGVFLDDRYDLFPLDVTNDYVRLYRGRPGALRALDRYDADAVLWPTDEPLTAQMEASTRWRRAAERQGWSLYLRATGER